MADQEFRGKLPNNLSEISAWRDVDLGSFDDYSEELGTRASEMSPEVFALILRENLVSGYDIYFWGNTLVNATSDPLSKFQFLQVILQNIDNWPEWEYASGTVEFLEFCWSTSTLARELPSEPDLLSSILRGLMRDPGVWRMPMAPAAIIAAHPVSVEDVQLILQAFISAWDLSHDMPEFIGFDGIGSHFEETDLELMAPLLALCTINPAAPMPLVESLLAIATFSDVDQFKLAFWEYVSACLTDNREYGGYWDPIEVWQRGFFGNGMATDAPPTDSAHVLKLLKHFKTYSQVLDLTNPHGERTLAAQVLTFLAGREDVDVATLEDIALNCLWVDPVRAAIANPKTPESSRAAGALRIS